MHQLWHFLHTGTCCTGGLRSHQVLAMPFKGRPTMYRPFAPPARRHMGRQSAEAAYETGDRAVAAQGMGCALHGSADLKNRSD
mmetsp:Transcript_20052/g.50060  ORF Transcript_20052/g.50060 Transcript_20052/m.50060 type:complete len:83 (+) Transcript_20052:348-596(+)